MFNYIGEKIRIIAIASFILGTFLSIGSSIYVCNIFDKVFDTAFGVLIIMFFVIAATGTALAWAISILIYGFGRLVENSERIAYMYEETQENYEQEYEDDYDGEE